MRYFFLTYALIAVLVVGIGGFRGQHFSKPPVQVFPDMDNQDKLKAQAPSTFFADRQGDRLPVDGTQPRGFNEEGAQVIGGIPEYEFGGETGYYYTGHVGDYFGTGMPEELQLDSAAAAELIRRGEERYGIFCSVCHGETGNGLGITGRFGVPGIANLHLDPFKAATYPDGRMFEVITLGKGQMGGYGANIPVRDRWAIIAYVRTLQAAKEVALAQAEAAQPAGDEADGDPPVGTTKEVVADRNPTGVTGDAADNKAVVTPEGPLGPPPATGNLPADPAEDSPSPETETEANQEEAPPADQ